MTKIELKPCPKCQGTHQHFRRIYSGKIIKWWIHCICGYFSPAFDSLEEAFEAWNRRADNG